MNNVILTGRLTKAPERPAVTASGRQVLDLRMAVNHHRRDTVFVDVKCWEGSQRRPPTTSPRGRWSA
jgi:single-stranded DNA-binding protein